LTRGPVTLEKTPSFDDHCCIISCYEDPSSTPVAVVHKGVSLLKVM
jgi:hypothetical protein